jgi:Protein of unknown function (DUF2637)
MRGIKTVTTHATAPAGPRRGDALVANTVALILGTASFSVSFTHVVHVAQDHGQGGWVANAIAASVELMALASVAELRRRKSRGESVWIAVAVLLLGVSMSLASNLETAAAGVWGKLMAAWPAVAFLAVAALVESRTGAPADSGQATRTDDAVRTGQAAEVRTGQAAEVRTEPVRTGAPAPYGTRTESARTDDAVRTEETRTDEAADARTEQIPAPVDAVDQTTAAPVPAAVEQPADEPVDEPQDAPPVLKAPAAVAPVPVALAATPARLALTSGDTSDSASDSVLVALADTADSPAVPAPAAKAAPAPGWVPGASGLLLPPAYAAAAEKPALIVPGRPAVVPGPRPQAPASARTDKTRPRTPARPERRTDVAARPDKARTPARTDSPRTDRPARTDVVSELVREIRTDARWHPDYTALSARTGYGRSFLEKCMSDARKAVTAN